MNTRILEIRKSVLNKNNQAAAQLRERFRSSQVIAINVVSSPGSGKTVFLEQTLRGLRAHGLEAAALVGDLGAGDDGRRLAASGAPVRQINTHGLCHLEAGMIAEHLGDWDLQKTRLRVRENVGNLVCPSNYDLGESLRAAVLSVDEGEDKPLKYPGMFHSADIAVVTKSDLAEACDFDRC